MDSGRKKIERGSTAVLPARAMRQGSHKGPLLLATVFLGLWLTAAAAGENLALGKSYTLVPEPNYSYCTDSGDITQLTDGALIDPGVTPWLQVGCVGWNIGQDADAEVVIDLGAVHPIDWVRIWTSSSPGADVYLPDVLIAVSDDGAVFHVVKRIDMTAGPHLWRTNISSGSLVTRGRYVLIRLTANYGPFIFTDEIEVYRGAHDPNSVVLPEETIERMEIDHRSELKDRLMRALDRLLPRLPALADNITALRSEIDAAPTFPVGKNRYLDNATATDFKQRTLALQRGLSATWLGSNNYLVWGISPWEEVLPAEFPGHDVQNLSTLQIVAGRNEYESAAVMVSNAQTMNRNVKFTLGSITGPNPWLGSVVLRWVRFMDYTGNTNDPEGMTLADALPRVPSNGYLYCPSRETRQIWVQVHTGQTLPGTYQGTLTINDYATPSKQVTVSIQVLPVDMPSDPPVATYSWQYIDSIATVASCKPEAAADLASHYSNVAMLSNNCIPQPYPGVPTNFSALDAAITLHQSIMSKGITWFPSLTFSQWYAPSSQEYQAYDAWVASFVNHLQGLGIGYDDFFVYPVDENIKGDFITSGQMIRSLDPNIRIFADPLMRDADEYLIAAAPYVDIWCPPILPPDHPQLHLLQGEGKTLWSYTVNRRIRHPYSSYRLALWGAYKMGATGCGFWCYAVAGGSWSNDNMWYDSPYAYAVIYTLTGKPSDVPSTEKIIPSKRWEAWREGIEDYTYLDMLQKRITQCQSIPGMATKVQQAELVLATAVQSVTENPEQVDYADAHRQAVLQAIMDLTLYTVTGTVSLEDYPPGPANVPASIQLIQGRSVRTDNVTLDAAGHFSLANVASGTYAVRVKASHWLAQTQNVTVSGDNATITPPFSLTNGDSDGDNQITTGDLSLILSCLDALPASPAWLPEADLDGDNAVTSTDLAIVLSKMN